MIELRRVSKAYRTRSGIKTVLRDVDLSLPRGRSVALIGVNGAGKSTLLRLIAGTELPDRGRIVRRARISWPLAATGGFNGSLTGMENVRFVARIYGACVRRTVDFVEDFSDLGPYFHMPVRTYSTGMRARLAFGLSMAIDFDCYLVDEITGVGDAGFQKKCQAAFAERRSRSDVIMVSHQVATLRTYCQAAVTLDQGRLTYHDDVATATGVYLGRTA
jgi:capsular polysaccharide transport system ATP-binding protein